jgi:hypothetical protein
MPSDFDGPGWDLLTDAVQRSISVKRIAPNTDKFMVRTALTTRPLLLHAAQARGVSTDTYIRRALSAFLVYDLGLDWWELLSDEPWATLSGQSLHERRPLAGAGYGPWQIDSLSEVP